jgi:hypothetical protein
MQLTDTFSLPPANQLMSPLAKLPPWTRVKGCSHCSSSRPRAPQNRSGLSMDWCAWVEVGCRGVGEFGVGGVWGGHMHHHMGT